MRASSSIEPIQLELARDLVHAKPDTLFLGFLILTVLVIIAGLLGAL